MWMRSFSTLRAIPKKVKKKRAKKAGVLFSIHLKSNYDEGFTDPIQFLVNARKKLFFEPICERHQATFDELGVEVTNNGLLDLFLAHNNVTTRE